MHKYTQNQSYVGSSGQTLTTDVSMSLCNWQICHQTQVSCGRTTFVPNQIRYQINTVPTPTVAWTRVQLSQGGGGGTSPRELHFQSRSNHTHAAPCCFMHEQQN